MSKQPEVWTECVCFIDQFSAERFLAVLRTANTGVMRLSHFFFFFFSPSQGAFGPIFLGAVSSRWETPGGAGEGSRRFVGCIGKLRVDSNDSDLIGEAVRGRNIENCDPPVCQHLPCRNGGTCVRYEITFHTKYQSEVDRH